MFDEVKALLIEELSISEDAITPDAKLDVDLGINSLELAELAFRCEEKFDVQIADEDLKTLLTVGDVADYLEAHTK